MKKYAGVIRRSLFVAAGAAFLFGALANILRAGPLQKNITIAGSGALLPGNMATEVKNAEAEREDEVIFTAWRELKNMSVSDKDGLRNTSVDVLELYGPSELLIPYGKILNEDDTEGCLLGEAAAEKLFGNRNAAGLTLYYEDRLLTVRGVLKTPEEILVVENHENQEGFERITVKQMESGNRMKGAELLTGRYGIPADSVSLNLFEAEQLLSLIPGKWADFPGWSRNLKAWNQKVGYQQALPKSSLEMIYLQYRRQGLLFLGAGIFCILAAGIRCNK